MNSELLRKQGKFLMLAFDHRGSFVKLINPQDPKSVKPEEVIEVKKKIIESLYPYFSGLLIDQEYGLPAYKSMEIHEKRFLLPMEKSGYQEDNGERVTVLTKNAQEIIDEEACASKLLIYVNPKHKNFKKQLETTKKALADSKAHNLPFFLEIVHYDMEPNVVNTIDIFLKEGIRPDVYKLEYPGSEENCQKVTEMLEDIPWIILTRGAKFEKFVEQFEVANSNGCQGFLAGRALWQELLSIKDPNEIARFLKETLPKRFRILTDIAL